MGVPLGLEHPDLVQGAPRGAGVHAERLGQTCSRGLDQGFQGCRVEEHLAGVGVHVAGAQSLGLQATSGVPVLVVHPQVDPPPAQADGQTLVGGRVVGGDVGQVGDARAQGRGDQLPQPQTGVQRAVGVLGGLDRLVQTLVRPLQPVPLLAELERTDLDEEGRHQRPPGPQVRRGLGLLAGASGCAQRLAVRRGGLPHDLPGPLEVTGRPADHRGLQGGPTQAGLDAVQVQDVVELQLVALQRHDQCSSGVGAELRHELGAEQAAGVRDVAGADPVSVTARPVAHLLVEQQLEHLAQAHLRRGRVPARGDVVEERHGVLGLVGDQTHRVQRRAVPGHGRRRAAAVPRGTEVVHRQRAQAGLLRPVGPDDDDRVRVAPHGGDVRLPQQDGADASTEPVDERGRVLEEEPAQLVSVLGGVRQCVAGQDTLEQLVATDHPARGDQPGVGHVDPPVGRVQTPPGAPVLHVVDGVLGDLPDRLEDLRLAGLGVVVLQPGQVDRVEEVAAAGAVLLHPQLHPLAVPRVGVAEQVVADPALLADHRLALHVDDVVLEQHVADLVLDVAAGVHVLASVQVQVQVEDLHELLRPVALGADLDDSPVDQSVVAALDVRRPRGVPATAGSTTAGPATAGGALPAREVDDVVPRACASVVDVRCRGGCGLGGRGAERRRQRLAGPLVGRASTGRRLLQQPLDQTLGLEHPGAATAHRGAGDLLGGVVDLLPADLGLRDPALGVAGVLLGGLRGALAPCLDLGEVPGDLVVGGDDALVGVLDPGRGVPDADVVDVDLDELVERVPSRDVVGEVALACGGRGQQEVHLGCACGGEPLVDGQPSCPPGAVAVEHDVDDRTGERCGELGREVLPAAGVGGRDQPEPYRGRDVLLPLEQPDGLPGGDGALHRGQAVQHRCEPGRLLRLDLAGGVVDVALREGLARAALVRADRAHDLLDEHVVGVEVRVDDLLDVGVLVVVLRDGSAPGQGTQPATSTSRAAADRAAADAPALLAVPLGRGVVEQVDEREAQRLSDRGGVGLAAVAVQHHAPAVAVRAPGHVQRTGALVVDGAQCLEVARAAARLEAGRLEGVVDAVQGRLRSPAGRAQDGHRLPRRSPCCSRAIAARHAEDT